MSCNRSFALVYPDGTKQLVTHSSVTQSFEQRRENGFISGPAFFGDQPLRLIPSDNELLPNTAILDQHSAWVDLFTGKAKE
jgi:hypothetical protein